MTYGKTKGYTGVYCIITSKTNIKLKRYVYWRGDGGHNRRA